jgi:hypothetical protein
MLVGGQFNPGEDINMAVFNPIGEIRGDYHGSACDFWRVVIAG